MDELIKISDRHTKKIFWLSIVACFTGYVVYNHDSKIKTLTKEIEELKKG